MPDMLADGADWLARKQRSYASRVVKYARGESNVSLRATPGRSSYNVTDSAGLLVQVQTDDWIVYADDLILDGIKAEPLAGDTITSGDFTFRVLAPFEGEPHFRPVDQYRRQLRVHTKLNRDARTP